MKIKLLAKSIFFLLICVTVMLFFGPIYVVLKTGSQMEEDLIWIALKCFGSLAAGTSMSLFFLKLFHGLLPELEETLKDTDTASTYLRAYLMDRIYFWTGRIGLVVSGSPTRALALIKLLFGIDGIANSAKIAKGVRLKGLSFIRLGDKVELEYGATLSALEFFNSGDLRLAKIQIEEGAKIGRYARVSPGVLVCRGARIGAEVSLGAHVKVGKKTNIGKDTIVADGAKIGDFCVIGSNCIIGPHCRIPSGMIIPDRSVFPKNLDPAISDSQSMGLC